jgi:hypothetical protein
VVAKWLSRRTISISKIFLVIIITTQPVGAAVRTSVIVIPCNIEYIICRIYMSSLG